MKSKKLAIAMTALAMVPAFAFTACDNTNNPNGTHTTHEYEWTVKTPATCTEDGVEEGVCSICGKETERQITAGHNYSDWQITAMPSEDGKGSALKVCANDAEHDHDIEVELPVFDRAGQSKYAAYEKKDHVVTFSYAHESGNITASTVASVHDAIELGVENKAKIVSGNAEVYHDYKIYETQSKGNISYEFGDNYLHVNDAAVDRREYFYDLNDDGSMFPVYTEWKTISKDGQAENDPNPIKTDYRETLNNKDATPEMMGGFGYFFTWLNGDHKEYGVENFINYIYNEYYSVNANQDATASVVVQNDGTLLFKFSVGVHSTLNIDLLHIIDVSFTLDDNNVIKTAVIKNRTWNDPVQDDKTLLWSVPADSEYVVMDQYTIEQQTEREEGAAIPSNPYKLEDMLLTSYDMVLDGETLRDGVMLEVDADTVTKITLENIQPNTYNLNFDEITVSLTDSEGNVKSCIPSATHLADGEILAQVLTLRSYDGETISKEDTLQIKSLCAGEFTLTIKSAKLTKTIKLKVNTIAPSEFGATVYEYNPMNSSWDIDDYNSEFTVYAGQSFNFTSYVAHPFYEEKGFTLSVSRGTDEGIEDDYTIGSSVIEGVSLSKFVASVAGDYTLTLTNLKQRDGADVTADVTVHVIPAPDMAEVLVGKYFNINDGFELTFTPSADGATSGEATLVTGVGGKNPTNTVLSYAYNGEGGVTLTHVSGALSTYNFSLVFDDAYNMFLSYTTAMGTKRTVYLYNVVPNLIEGTYRITMAAENAVKLVVNIEGKYSITANSYSGVYFAIFDVKTDRQTSENISLTPSTVVDLEVGQFIKVWCIGLHTDANGNPVGELPTEYTVTFISETAD